MNDNAVYLLHRGAAIAGKPCSYRIGFQKGRLRRPFFMGVVWAILGLSRAAVEPGVEQGITDDHQ
jgi:hypothetical protein